MQEIFSLFCHMDDFFTYSRWPGVALLRHLGSVKKKAPGLCDAFFGPVLGRYGC